jgi:glycosyltransferase involved in cell wall biosynthesis
MTTLAHHCFVGINCENERFTAVVVDCKTGDVINVETVQDQDYFLPTRMLFWLRKFSQSSGACIVAVGLVGVKYSSFLASSLWLQEDIVPFFFSKTNVEESLNKNSSRSNSICCTSTVSTAFDESKSCHNNTLSSSTNEQQTKPSAGDRTLANTANWLEVLVTAGTPAAAAATTTVLASLCTTLNGDNAHAGAYEAALNAAYTVSTWFNKDEWVSDRPKRLENSRIASLVLGPLERSPYRTTVSETEWGQLKFYAELFRKQDNSLLFINSTPQGGGVALMRHSLLRVFNSLNLGIYWINLEPDVDGRVFSITKQKIHNALQNVGEQEDRLTDEDKEVLRNWSAANAKRLSSSILGAKVIVIDDPQPVGLILHILKLNPTVKLVFRCHIQISTVVNDKGSRAWDAWQFLWENLQHVHVFVFHPVTEFVPQNVPPELVVLMPATTDPLDGLNKELGCEREEHYIHIFNRLMFSTGQLPLNPQRPVLSQIARFDPSKGIPDVVAAYALLVRKLIAAKWHKFVPQLVLAGHGALDDPEGTQIYVAIRKLVQEKYSHLRHDIKTAYLPPKDQILNSLARMSRVGLQLSIREGFEVKVTELLLKGVPVVIYDTGGMPLQVQHGVNGM